MFRFLTSQLKCFLFVYFVQTCGLSGNKIGTIYVFADTYFLWRKEGMTHYSLYFTVINPVPVYYHNALEKQRYSALRIDMGLHFC